MLLAWATMAANALSEAIWNVYVATPLPPVTCTFETVSVTWPETCAPFAGLTGLGAVMVTLAPVEPPPPLSLFAARGKRKNRHDEHRENAQLSNHDAGSSLTTSSGAR